MRRARLFLFTIVVLIFAFIAPAPGCAQQWSGIIDPSRAIDWSNVGISGGIPNRTTICATLNPGASAAQISSAIASCPSGQVVFLLTMHDLESFRSAQGLTSSLPSYFTNTGLNKSASLRGCMESIAEKVIERSYSNTNET